MRLKGDIAALFAGLLMPLAFAPFGLYSLGIIAPALLLLAWLAVSPKRALWRGLLFGIGYFALGLYWVYISVHQYGNASMPLALFIVVLLVLIMALYPAVQGYFLTRLFPQNTASKYLLAFPASWVFFEWLRSTLFSGFPWLLLGDSQLPSPLAGLAPLFSTYGVALATTFTSGVLVTCLRIRKPSILYKSAGVLIFLWAIAWGFKTHAWTTSTQQPLTVSMIQADIPQEEKWNPDRINAILSHYWDTTSQQKSSDLIIWPEAAITINQYQATEFLYKLNQQAKENNQALLVGLPILDQNQYYNGLLAVGDGHGEYRKQQLVPFGEYLPLTLIFEPLFNYISIPMSSFMPGAPLPPIMVKGIPIATFICYEIAFPNLVRKSAQQSQLMVTLADDSWFGRSIALPQHLQMAQMRALENGRSHLLATNNGITAIIDSQGNIVKNIPPFTQDVLVGTTYPITGTTPWQLWGLWPVWLCIVGCLFVAIRKRPKLI